MSFRVTNQTSIYVFIKRKLSKRDPLVQLYIVSDNGSTTNDHTRTVIDKETGSKARAGVYVDAGPVMRMLRHYSRYQRNTHSEELVCEAISHDSVNAGIAEYDFVQGIR